MITKIQLELDEDKKCGLLSLDLCKAFDTVDHVILLEKIFDIGIRGNAFLWFQNYLSNRNQFVCIENSRSSSRNIVCGVPQGSILGPVLFLIYINSISELNICGKLILFADDTTLIYFDKNPNNIEKLMQSDLSQISHWLNEHKLTLNFKKSSYMFIDKKPLLGYSTKSILMGNEKIQISNSTKFLGLYIDNKLSWNFHIEILKKSSIYYRSII